MAKILLEQIQQEANELQWKLISSEYKNLKSELNWICPNGHSVVSSYGQWRKSHTCPMCELKSTRITADVIVPKARGSYRVLGLDQATRTTGWAIFENGKLIRYGTFTTKSNDEPQRINEVKEWLWNIISVWKIDYVQMEDIQLQDHSEGNRDMGVTVYKALAHLQGVLENLCLSNDIDHSFVFPATWRKYNDIKGRSRADKKKNAQLRVQSLYGFAATADECEAICIGAYAAHNHTKSTTLVSWE